MTITANIFLNAIVFFIFCLSLYFYVINRKSSNDNKKVISITSLVLVFLLAAFSTYSILSIQKKKRSFKVIRPKIIEVKDLSGFEAKKYLVNIIVPPGLTKGQVRTVVSDSTKFIKSEKKDASVIWLAVFNKELPREELNTKKDNPYLIALSQWVSSSYTGFLKNRDFKSKESYRSIDIFWNY